MAADAQHNMGRGFQGLSRFFDGGVRNRGLRYVGKGAISLVENTRELLAARVQGTQGYVTAFARAGDCIRYACSCRYFVGSMNACKHLFALALEQARSELVTNASTCRMFSPDDGILAGLADDENDDLDDNFDAASPMGHPQFARFGDQGLSWRDVATQIDAERAGAKAKLELLYFLVPSLEPSSTSVVVGQRRLGAAPEAFNAVTRLDADLLLHDLDRELFVMLLATLANQFASYRSPSTCTAPLPPAVAPEVLAKLARTGRCRVVPSSLPPEVKRDWFLFSTGKAGPKVKGRPGYDFGKLLTLPLLTRDEGEEYGLSLTLREPQAKARPKAKRSFEIEAQLFRGVESRATLDVRYVHKNGSVIVGAELVRCVPSDAAWLGAVAEQRSLGRVAEREVQEFVDRVFGRYGVSALSLPPEYERREQPSAPIPTLDLEAPSGKKLLARVAFDYAGRRVPAEQESPLVIEERRVWERHRAAERQALDSLLGLGFSGELLGNARQPRAGHVSIDEKALAPALRVLLAAGWLVQGEGKRYRAASAFDIEVESGIDWFEVKGGVKFEGGELAFPKLLAAIKQRRSVVRLGDGSFGVLPEEWMQRWGLVAELATGTADSLRVSSRQIGLLQALLTALPEQDAGARGLQALRRKLDDFHTVKPTRAPRGFRGALRPYQEQGLGWLSTLGELGFGVCIADDMGLGKTIQVLAYLEDQRQKRKKSRKASLVVVPRSLLSNWLEEAQRFAPRLSIRPHWGPERQRTVERLRALRSEGHRALVFSQFTSLLSIVRERLTAEGISFEYLDGKTLDRAGAVERFQSTPSIDVFLISLKAGGVGLNLTAADYVFILDPWWNPAAEAQAIDRAHRIGQTRSVIAYRLLAKHTVEERVAHLQAQKRDLVAGIMGDDQALAARLTRGDLEALLNLTASGPSSAIAPNA